MKRRDRVHRAFSLVELVIVIAIIGIVAAIAAPRLSRGATAAGESSLSESLSAMRTAIDIFYVEHDGMYPPFLKFEVLMTQYSSKRGVKTGARDPANGVIYGPYLRTMPPLPVGANRGKTAVVAAFGDDGGWVYDGSSGTIRANCKGSEVDSTGKRYADY